MVYCRQTLAVHFAESQVSKKKDILNFQICVSMMSCCFLRVNWKFLIQSENCMTLYFTTRALDLSRLRWASIFQLSWLSFKSNLQQPSQLWLYKWHTISPWAANSKQQSGNTLISASQINATQSLDETTHLSLTPWWEKPWPTTAPWWAYVTDQNHHTYAEVCT